MRAAADELVGDQAEEISTWLTQLDPVGEMHMEPQPKIIKITHRRHPHRRARRRKLNGHKSNVATAVDAVIHYNSEAE